MDREPGDAMNEEVIQRAWVACHDETSSGKYNNFKEKTMRFCVELCGYRCIVTEPYPKTITSINNHPE